MLSPAWLFLGTISIACATIPLSSPSNEVNQFHKKKMPVTGGSLYPQASETRDLRNLDGIWNFRKSPSDPNYGYRHRWYEQDLEKSGPIIHMPVPSSYNDVTQDASLRDHVGLVWYDRRFFVPSSWNQAGQRVWLRFGSVNYAAQVWVNGKMVFYHEIGHLPFEVEVTRYVSYNSSNLLTVVVDNVLTSDTVPQGSVRNYAILEQRYTFDFLNYAGIHRSVFLHSTPQIYIDDVIVNYDIQGHSGMVVYNVTYQGTGKSQVQCLVQIFDKNDTEVQVDGNRDCAGILEVPNANLWWPYLMHPDPGYLYTMKASLLDLNGGIIDTYTQKIGIRTVSANNVSLLINGKPMYLQGFGMHEDSDLRGKGWDPVLWVKNFNLIKWVGANVFRTSHYPYAEEIYQLADEHGIMIIDECPSVNAELYHDKLLRNHKQSLTEMIHRDKNHPSVIMWSIANEPQSGSDQAGVYFEKIANHVRSMDVSRPITLAISTPINNDKSGQHLDVISFNRYNGWYTNPGQLYKITDNVALEATSWHQKHNKPVIMTEYGADTMSGLHYSPEFIWSEEYQVSLMSEHFKAFDQMRKEGWFVGEFIWNFADFMTAQLTNRVGGNRKGIFTRNRQPKASAHHLRARYLELAAADAGAAPPPQQYYTSNHQPVTHQEL